MIGHLQGIVYQCKTRLHLMTMAIFLGLLTQMSYFIWRPWVCSRVGLVTRKPMRPYLLHICGKLSWKWFADRRNFFDLLKFQKMRLHITAPRQMHSQRSQIIMNRTEPNRSDSESCFRSAESRAVSSADAMLGLTIFLAIPLRTLRPTVWCVVW